MNNKALLYLLGLLLVFPCCEPSMASVEVFPYDAVAFPAEREYRDYDTTSVALASEHPGVVNMRRRAYQIANIRWTPEHDVPQRYGECFTANVPVKGILYSSVKEKDKFIGQEVSFHTFMTAVHNPASVLYTERVDEYPYHGTNCAAYYGTVCSMAVNYALGLERPYVANMYRALPIFQRVTVQDLSCCSDGDVIWVNGHVILITKVSRNERGEISKIEILESAGRGTAIKNYTFQAFKDRWKDSEWVLLRYKYLSDNLEYTEIPFVDTEGNPVQGFTYNDDLCASRGDRACYQMGETVVVDVFNHSYDSIVLLKDGVVVREESAQDMTEWMIDADAPGLYSVVLKKGDEVSDCTGFEVIDTSVETSFSGNMLKVQFDSMNGVPEYMVFCQEDGGRFFICDITGEDRTRGYKWIDCQHSLNGVFLKVFFKGEYGRVSNQPIALL